MRGGRQNLIQEAFLSAPTYPLRSPILRTEPTLPLSPLCKAMSIALAPLTAALPVSSMPFAPGNLHAQNMMPLAQAVSAAPVPSLPFSLELLRGSNEPYRLPTRPPNSFRDIVLKAVNLSAAASPPRDQGITLATRCVPITTLPPLCHPTGN